MDLLERIKRFEGWTPRAAWDYKQHSNGYGTRARHPGEVIDRVEGQLRLTEEVDKARAIVEQHAPNAPPGVKDALTSLTFNAGDKWARSGLGDAIRRGNYEAAKPLFLQYNKAGGATNPGLVSRRIQEAAWWDSPSGGYSVASGQVPAGAPAAAAPPGPPAPRVASATQPPRGQPLPAVGGGAGSKGPDPIGALLARLDTKPGPAGNGALKDDPIASLLSRLDNKAAPPGGGNPLATMGATLTSGSGSEGSAHKNAVQEADRVNAEYDRQQAEILKRMLQRRQGGGLY